jgi:hypothetical protein
MIFSAKTKVIKKVGKLARSLTLIKPLDVNLQESITLHNSLHRPNHRSVIVIGGGQAGTLIMNRLNRHGGFEATHSTLIDKRAYLWVHEGLDLFVYDIMEEIDVKKPILGRIQDLTPMLVEEVIHFDPANHYIGTYDGTELTFNYCVIASSLEPDISSVKGLEFALYDKYSHVTTTTDFDQALKMRQRLEFTKGKDLAVYCAGTLGNEFSRPVNHALLLRWKYPQANLSFFVNGHSISGNEVIDKALAALFKEKKIEIVWDRKLIEINSEQSATLESSSGETQGIDFDLMYVDPHMKQPKFLTDAGISKADFSLSSFQHRVYPPALRLRQLPGAAQLDRGPARAEPCAEPQHAAADDLRLRRDRGRLEPRAPLERLPELPPLSEQRKPHQHRDQHPRSLHQSGLAQQTRLLQVRLRQVRGLLQALA